MVNKNKAVEAKRDPWFVRQQSLRPLTVGMWVNSPTKLEWLPPLDIYEKPQW